MKKLIAISVVYYSNEDEIIAFAEKLQLQTYRESIVLLVTYNGGSKWNELCRRLEGLDIRCGFFESQKNLGYLHGCLFGLQQFSENYDYAVVCNTDLDFQQNEFFEIMLREDGEEIWCIGPRIILCREAVNQNPFMIERPSVKQIWKWRLLFSNYFFYQFCIFVRDTKKKLKRVKPNPARTVTRNVYAVHGSFIMLKKDCVDKIIQLHDPIFMYEEELLIAEVVKKENKKIRYCEEAGLIHKESQVTGKINTKEKLVWKRNSFDYLYKQFFCK